MSNWWEKEENWFDCFEELEIDENASAEKIKNAFRTLAKKYHPDNKEYGDEKKFKKLKIAYETLKDKKTKEEYIAYKKKREKNKDNFTEEENITFETILNNYKERENQVKLAINKMIVKVEEKEEKYLSLYKEFCKTLKSGNLNKSEFEIRKQKLRSVELSSINSILEIRQIINNDLKDVNLDIEKRKLRKLMLKFKLTDIILTSSYKKALNILNLTPIKFKKRYAAIIPFGIILGCLYFSNVKDKEEIVEKEIVAVESDDTNYIEEESSLEKDNDDYIKEIALDKEEPCIIDEEYPYYLLKEMNNSCILFKDLPKSIDLNNVDEKYEDKICGRKVLKIEKDGIDYLIDANTKEIILGNYHSSGGPYDENGRYEMVFLGIDGCDYTIDAEDLKTIYKIESIYSFESEPFYLESYGNVIETEYNGHKYLLDAETRYPLAKRYDSYEPMYYDEELGCDVYCFTDDSIKYYFQASDLTKVLKIDYGDYGGIDNFTEVKNNCVLFKEVEKDIVYDEISEPFKIGDFEVKQAKKDGIKYLLDAQDDHIMIANYFSYGNPMYVGGTDYGGGTEVIKFEGIDSYEYTLNTNDLKTIIGINSIFLQESDPFYLDGYGYVIEGMGFGGEKTLIDAVTRQFLLKDSEGYEIYYNNYNGIYYDKELGCDVYCFTTDGPTNYLISANNLKKVLKIKENY